MVAEIQTDDGFAAEKRLTIPFAPFSTVFQPGW